MPTFSVHRFSFVSRFGPLTLITLGSLWLLQSVFAHTGSHGVLMTGLDYNAGIVADNTTINHTVKVVNLTAEPIEIDAQPSCGCTLASVPDKIVYPFHAEALKSQIDTQIAGLGRQRKIVVYTLKSPEKTWQCISKMDFVVKKGH